MVHRSEPEPKQETAHKASKLVTDALRTRLHPTAEEAKVAVEALELVPAGHMCTECGLVSNVIVPGHNRPSDEGQCAGATVPVYRAYGLETVV